MRLNGLLFPYVTAWLQIVMICIMGHNGWVISPIRHLRRLIARAPLGLRALVCLMVLSLGMSATLSSELHEHQQAAADHHHHADWDHDVAPANPDAGDLPATLHFHDAPLATQAILSSELSLLPSQAPSSLCSMPLTPLRHTCPSSPPHRPPIV